MPTLADDQKGELWGKWLWYWDGQDDCSSQAYSGSSAMLICHTTSTLNVTFGGATYPATWDGTTLTMDGARLINGRSVDPIHMTMTIANGVITGGTGTYFDATLACGGTETYTGSWDRQFLWDGMVYAKGDPCWLWTPP